MAVKNTDLGGASNWSDGDILYASDLNDTFSASAVVLYADNTGGSTTSTETDLATITVTQDDLDSDGNLVISSGIRFINGAGTTQTGTFKLYIDGVVKKTITLVAASGSNQGTAFTWNESSFDSSTGNKIVKVTGASTNASAQAICDGLNVTGYKY